MVSLVRALLVSVVSIARGSVSAGFIDSTEIRFIDVSFFPRAMMIRESLPNAMFRCFPPNRNRLSHHPPRRQLQTSLQISLQPQPNPRSRLQSQPNPRSRLQSLPSLPPNKSRRKRAREEFGAEGASLRRHRTSRAMWKIESLVSLGGKKRRASLIPSSSSFVIP